MVKEIEKLKFEFFSIAEKSDDKNLREALLEGFHNISLENEMNNIDLDTEVQNKILVNYMRFLKEVFAYNLKSKKGLLSCNSIKMMLPAVKAGMLINNINKVITYQNDEKIIKKIDFPEESQILFNHIFEAIAFVRCGERQLNKDSLSVKLLNIIVGKIITLINANKIKGLGEDLKFYNIYYAGKKLTPAKKDKIWREYLAGNKSLDDLIIREISE